MKLECETKYIEMLENCARNKYEIPSLKKVESIIKLCYKDIAKCDRYLRDPIFLDVSFIYKALLYTIPIHRVL